MAQETTKQETAKQFISIHTNKQSKSNQQLETKPNRNYKDTLFRMLFSDKNNLLSLYNAINGSNYDNVDDLKIVTLENAIFMAVKNDLAFIIDAEINLFEHQSTFCPNMPLRDLFYIAKEYEKLTTDKSIYSLKKIKIPTPKFVVFYNGIESQPEKQILKLSDLFEQECDEPDLELKVTMYNINSGYNISMRETCKILNEYMIYIEKVRIYKEELNFELAVQRAIEECINENVLAEFLIKNKAEVIAMSIFEYDEEKHKRIIQEDSIEIGIAMGEARGEARGKAESILAILEELGEISYSLQEQIMAEKDLEILKKWLQTAIKTSSIDDFIEAIK